MKEVYINFKTAKLAKECGFPQKQDTYPKYSYDGILVNYTNTYSAIEAPTQSLLQKWLRDIHGIYITIDCNGYGKYRNHAYNVDVSNKIFPQYKGVEDTNAFEFGTSEYDYLSYEECLETILQEALWMIKNTK